MYKYFSTGQFKNAIRTVHERAFFHGVAVPALKFQGTVKLHGSNSSIYSRLNAPVSEENFITQSKNNIITPQEDNLGFARFINQVAQKEDIVSIFEAIKGDYPQHVQDKTAVIYGEWCGQGIQHGVALSQVEKMFVIFAIKLSDNEQNNDAKEIWLSRDQINKVCAGIGKENKIFNIHDFKTWELEIDMNNPKLIQNELIRITNEVEAQCPVGEAFGVKGIGEGVVWKCVSEHPLIQTDDLVFKVKGREHSVTHVKTIAEVDVEKVNSINEFVEKVVTPNRLAQGLDYLREQQLAVDVSNMSVFLKWIYQDATREEADILKESGLESKEVGKAINNTAKQWFFEAVRLSKQTDNCTDNSTSMAPVKVKNA